MLEITGKKSQAEKAAGVVLPDHSVSSSGDGYPRAAKPIIEIGGRVMLLEVFLAQAPPPDESSFADNQLPTPGSI